MNSVDAEILRAIRREFAKHPIDTTRMDLQCVSGRVSVGGSITVLRDQPLVDLHFEVAMIEKFFSRNMLIKQWTFQARLLIPEKEDKHHDGERGRLRH